MSAGEMSAGDTGRQRNSLSADALVEILKPFASHKGFIKYDESPKQHEAKVHLKLLKDLFPILQAIHEQDNHLALKKAIVLQAFQSLFESKKKEWSLHDKFKDDWSGSMACRLCNACRATSQAMSKKNPPAWVAELPWKLGDAHGAEPAGGSGKGPVHEKFGFDVEHQIAYFVDSKGFKHVADSMSEPAGNPGETFMMAHWKDGKSYAVSDLTVEMYRRMKTKQPPKGNDIFFEGEMHDSHHRVQVKLRHDRALLCSLYEQSKQRMQVRVSVFGDPDTKEAQSAAAEMMTRLAKEFCDGKVKRRGLKARRDALLSELGLSTRQGKKKKQAASGTPMKRPAASSKEGPTKKVKVQDETETEECEDEEGGEEEEREKDSEVEESSSESPSTPVVQKAKAEAKSKSSTRAESAVAKPRTAAKAKPKTAAKAKPKSAAKAKTKSPAKPKTSAKAKTKSPAKPKSPVKAKAKSASKAKSPAKLKKKGSKKGQATESMPGPPESMHEAMLNFFRG